MQNNNNLERSNSEELNDLSYSDWDILPEPILLTILYYLSPNDVINAGKACTTWYKISQDDFLWKKLLVRDYKCDKNLGLRPGIIFENF